MSDVDWGDAAAWAGAVFAMAAVVVAVLSWRASRRSAEAADRSARAAENQTKIQEQALKVAEEQTKLQQQAARAAEEQTELQQQAAQAAKEQTAIQRQLRVDSAQPYVWVDLRGDDVVGTLLHLIVGNSGPTFAENIRITVDRPLPAIDQMKDRVEAAQARLQEGIRSLGPGRRLVWTMGQGFNLLKAEGSQAYTFTVTADGPFGPIPPRTYVVDLSELHGVLDRPDGSLHELTKAVKDLANRFDPQSR